jgi:E3 ubiquitin-protein ligase RNF19A
MFSKSRKRHSSSNTTRSSLKHTTNNDSSITLTKDPVSGITIPIPSPTNSNLNFLTTQISSQKPSNSSATSNNNNGGIRRRFLNLLRFTASRPSSAVRFSRQHNTSTTSNSCQISKPKHSSLTLSFPHHDNNSITSSSAIIKDELIESIVASANEHVINIIPSTTNSGDHLLETCLLCCHDYSSEQFEHLRLCSHSYCRTCLKSYLKLEITEGRVTLNCPQSDCPERIHPSDISRILENHPELISKYEQFMVRRVLQSIVDTRWCPAPDCGFAVIASGYASCPEIQCLRPGCNTSFCYHCKSTWHPNKTCEDAAREKTSSKIRSGSFISLASAQQRDEIKQCPRCQASILKMDDGSCNHMTCPICEAEFCWLCGREISDLHYLSPSGCTFWGKKQWSRKKVILWQVATLIGAPVIIALIAGVAVPGVAIGVPIWAGRKIFKKYNKMENSKSKRNILVTLGVVGSVVASPIIATLAVGIGVPILLAYVYGVIPISLCRTGGCGIGTRNDMFDGDGPNLDNFLPFSLREVAIARALLNDTQSVTTHPTIGGDTNSLSNSVAHLVDDRSNESTKALPGTGAVSLCESLPPSNRLEVQAEVSDCKSFDIESITISEKSSKTMDSLKALAGSIKDACAAPSAEYNNENICSGNSDATGRKSSLLSSASDYARSINLEQQTNVNRASSPYNDKTVSFFDERTKVKSKTQTDRY